VKKLKYKLGSFTDSMERSTSRRGTVTRHWGSDEDLVRGVGLQVAPELRDIEEEPAARPAPMANGGVAPRYATNAHAVDRAWRFPSNDDTISDSQSLGPRSAEHNPAPHSPGEISSINTPRKVSFFDVGGLLDSPTSNDTQSILNARKASNASREAYFRDHPHMGPMNEGRAPSLRKGSSVLLHDIGGLLAPSTSNGGGSAMRSGGAMGLADILREDQENHERQERTARSRSKADRMMGREPEETRDRERSKSKGDKERRERDGSRNRLGGILGMGSSRKRSTAAAVEMQPMPARRNPPPTEEKKGTTGELQDVGGLLS
jgi:hypothetical protein